MLKLDCLPQPQSWPITYAPVVTAVIVAIVATFTAWVGWRQWVTAKTKVQLDLYSMRLPIYQATRKLLADITPRGFPTDLELWKFASDIEQAPFLFDDAFAERLNEIYTQAAGGRDSLNRVGKGTAKENAEWSKRSAAYMEWLREEYKKVVPAFAPYLKLEGRNGRR